MKPDASNDLKTNKLKINYFQLVTSEERPVQEKLAAGKQEMASHIKRDATVKT